MSNNIEEVDDGGANLMDDTILDTPQDCERFHHAIEEVVVPVARQIYDKRRKRLGLDSLRPWDLEVGTLGRAPLKPFTQISELVEKTETIFRNTVPKLGDYFAAMRSEDLLDLDNRKNKATGGYCTSFDFARKPFIFMNSVGLHEDVLTLLHEGGHAFHVYESAVLPYHHQLEVGMEFGEVASTAMELLAIPYMEISKGGFYKPEHKPSGLQIRPALSARAIAKSSPETSS